jgi:hypothetical protein
MKFRLFVAFLAVVALAACGTGSPTTPSSPPELLVSAPQAGQTFSFGQTVDVSWSCRNCSTLTPGVTAMVILVNVRTNSGYFIITGRPLTGRTQWQIPGPYDEPRDYYAYNGPGDYYVMVQSDPPVKDVATGEFVPEVVGRSGTFQLVQ